jgi:hypothetical protein
MGTRRWAVRDFRTEWRPGWAGGWHEAKAGRPLRDVATSRNDAVRLTRRYRGLSPIFLYITTREAGVLETVSGSYDCDMLRSGGR